MLHSGYQSFPLPPFPSSLSAGYLDDLHVFDTTAMNWTRLSFALDAPRPSARYGHGFTSAGGKLYVHGGDITDADGNIGDRNSCELMVVYVDCLLWRASMQHAAACC
jgi:hypothetical protein